MRLLGGILLSILSMGGAAAGERSTEAGAYRIRYWLELPHVERWAVEKTDTACIAGIPAASRSPLPILSANMPFKRCVTKALRSTGNRLDYDIVCAGRGTAKAHATYRFSKGAFEGRIFMTMGGKNMTMTEVQRGRRMGDCAAVASSH